MWFALMLLILLTNGMSAYGLKVIAEWGLPEATRFPYLAVWYAAGLAITLAALPARRIRVQRREWWWGLMLAASSIGGQIAMAVALARNVPGHVVFPIAVGGSILLVAVAGRLFFGERLNLMSACGVATGFAAIILLSIS